MKAVVTGASRGIGAACARALAANGMDVAVHYFHSREAAEKLAEEIGGKAFGADVSDPDAVRKLFAETGGADVLVCCAGIASQQLFTDITDKEWRKMLAVDLDGVFYCCREAAPSMIHRKYGRIITVSSMWGVTGASCETAYSAAKAGVIGLTKALAKELGPSGITVNCVAPGVVDTDMNRKLTAETLDALRKETPLERIGTPEEIAAAVRFLASEEAGFITGQVLGVNGGFII